MPKSGRSGASKGSDPMAAADVDRRMENASQRGRSGCVLGGIAKITKPLFFVSQNANFGSKMNADETCTQLIASAKSFEIIEDSCIF